MLLRKNRLSRLETETGYIDSFSRNWILQQGLSCQMINSSFLNLSHKRDVAYAFCIEHKIFCTKFTTTLLKQKKWLSQLGFEKLSF